MALSPAMIKFIELEKKKESIKQYFDELAAATEAVIKEIGIGGFFQDPTDRVVYRMVEPEGKFVKFDRYGYERTKREGERAGTLSVKAAEEAGFQVK